MIPHPQRWPRWESAAFSCAPRTEPSFAGQGGRSGVVLIEAFGAGAFSLASDRLHERPRGARSRTLRGKLFCRQHVIQLLAGDMRSRGPNSRLASAPVRCLAVLGEPAVQLGHAGYGYQGWHCGTATSSILSWWVPLTVGKQSGEPVRCWRSRCRCARRSRAVSKRIRSARGSTHPTQVPSPALHGHRDLG